METNRFKIFDKDKLIFEGRAKEVAKKLGVSVYVVYNGKRLPRWAKYDTLITPKAVLRKDNESQFEVYVGYTFIIDKKYYTVDKITYIDNKWVYDIGDVRLITNNEIKKYNTLYILTKRKIK